MGGPVRACVVLLAAAVAVMGTGIAAAQQKSPPLWNDLSPEQQGRAREHYERFRRMPERDRRGVEQRYRRWQNLPPTKRERMRQNYERYMKLNPAQRKEFDRDYRRWKSGRGAGGRVGTE